VHPRLQLGVEYNPAAEEIGPVATLFLFTESSRRPALFAGTSSDRIGSPRGKQGYYLTAAKSLGGIPIAPYVSLHYSEWDERFNVPFGAHADLAGGFWLRPMYDGERTHLTAGYSRDRFSVTALYVWLERPGVALSFGF
jgi:hypothetical protein